MAKGWNWRGARVIAAALVLALAVPSVAGAQGMTEREKYTSIATVSANARPSVVGILATFKSETARAKEQHGSGTGFVYKNGYVITNAHVIEDALELQILFPDKTVAAIRRVKDNAWWDRTADIGVVKVDTKQLAQLPFADSEKVQVGELVIAIGNPLGFRLGNTVTTGILSGTGRAMGSGLPFLQMDAPISPGNSGGPLLNAHGQVIGINSAKIADSGAEGLSLAIPANVAREVAEELIAKGKVERPWLGLMLREDWKAEFGVPNDDGVEIAAIVPDGPSDTVGLHTGDKLIKIDDQTIGTEDDVNAYLLRKRVGDAINLTVRRKGQTLTTRIKLQGKDNLKDQAQQSVQQPRGIYLQLSAGQVREAGEFGESLTYRGMQGAAGDYTAVSGSHTAVLYTEFLFVARRVLSAWWSLGRKPEVSFEQGAATSIRGLLEVRLEMVGDTADFLKDATVTLNQGSRKVAGYLVGSPGYLVGADGHTFNGQMTFRFSSSGIDPAGDVDVVVQVAGGKSVTFHWQLQDLR